MKACFAAPPFSSPILKRFYLLQKTCFLLKRIYISGSQARICELLKPKKPATWPDTDSSIRMEKRRRRRRKRTSWSWHLMVECRQSIPSAGRFSPMVIDKSQPIESMGSRLRDHTTYFVVRAWSNSRRTLPPCVHGHHSMHGFPHQNLLKYPFLCHL